MLNLQINCVIRNSNLCVPFWDFSVRLTLAAFLSKRVRNFHNVTKIHFSKITFRQGCQFGLRFYSEIVSTTFNVTHN